jgi:hypothetical protein
MAEAAIFDGDLDVLAPEWAGVIGERFELLLRALGGVAMDFGQNRLPVR